MSADPTLEAALKFVRPPWYSRIWGWYRRLTGYEKVIESRLRIRSTVFPEQSQADGMRCSCRLCDPRRLP